MDKRTRRELLVYILESLGMVRRRFLPITSPDDFTQSDEGIDRPLRA